MPEKYAKTSLRISRTGRMINEIAKRIPICEIGTGTASSKFDSGLNFITII